MPQEGFAGPRRGSGAARQAYPRAPEKGGARTTVYHNASVRRMRRRCRLLTSQCAENQKPKRSPAEMMNGLTPTRLLLPTLPITASLNVGVAFARTHMYFASKLIPKFGLKPKPR